ncbi:hypothetical protein [Calidithermus roseus]|nr:hypothetical protein [Calidithermus roseus]
MEQAAWRGVHLLIEKPIPLELPPHQGVLLFLSRERLEHVPERLP